MATPLKICPLVTNGGSGWEEPDAYHLELPNQQLARDFVAKWKVWPTYSNDETGNCRKQADVPGLTLVSPSAVRISPGGVMRAKTFLEQMGRTVVVEWARKRAGTAPHREVLPTLTTVSRPLIDQIAGQRRGLIEAAHRKERLKLIYAIMRLHPDARCQIIVGRNKDANTSLNGFATVVFRRHSSGYRS